MDDRSLGWRTKRNMRDSGERQKRRDPRSRSTVGAKRKKVQKLRLGNIVMQISRFVFPLPSKQTSISCWYLYPDFIHSVEADNFLQRTRQGKRRWVPFSSSISLA